MQKTTFLALALAFTVTSIEPASAAMRTFSNPRHTESGLPIAYSSDPDGVCIYLGYKKTLRGSSELDTDYAGFVGKSGRSIYRASRKDAMVIDSEGRPVRQKRAKTYGSLTCTD